jgi:AraC-binding-like domain
MAAWREIFGRTVVNLDIEPLNPEAFRAEAAVCQLPGLGVLRASSAAVHLSHPRELIVDDDLSFMAAPTCAYTASQLGRNSALGPGDGVLMSNADVGSMTLASECRFTTFRVPRMAIASLVPDLSAAFARRLRAGSAALQLLVSYLATALDTDALVAAELQQLAVAHVYDLLAVAMGATRDAAAIAAGRGVPAARLRAAKAFVAQQLGHRDLSAATVAAHLGVTPRYVHMLFETETQSFSESCWRSGSRSRGACSRIHVGSAAPSAPSRSTPGSPTYPTSTGPSAAASEQLRRKYARSRHAMAPRIDGAGGHSVACARRWMRSSIPRRPATMTTSGTIWITPSAATAP